MFIYQKNKVNEVTGQVEQSLNVTFEGNKPVETPDVVITKDGVTGIKSESTAYSFSCDGNPITVSSYSIDGEIAQYSVSSGSVLTFTKSVGFNVTNVGSGDIPLFYYSAVNNNGEFIFNNFYINDETPNVSAIGEYVIDMESKTIHTPSKDYDISSVILQYKKIYGFNIGYHGG